jgi:hypothetical protein
MVYVVAPTDPEMSISTDRSENFETSIYRSDGLADMLQTVWNELDYRVDVCRITKGADIEQL